MLPVATIVGTQSRSMETRFASRDNLSITPRARIRRKITSFHWCSFNGRASVGSIALSVDVGISGCTSLVMMTAQQTQAAITTTRLTKTVVKRVRNLDGAWSTQRPKDEAKAIMARLVVIPLKHVVRKKCKKRPAVKTYIHEAALRPWGKAAAVKSTEANSYDLAFHVDRKWQRNKLYVTQS